MTSKNDVLLDWRLQGRFKGPCIQACQTRFILQCSSHTLMYTLQLQYTHSNLLFQFTLRPAKHTTIQSIPLHPTVHPAPFAGRHGLSAPCVAHRMRPWPLQHRLSNSDPQLSRCTHTHTHTPCPSRTHAWRVRVQHTCVQIEVAGMHSHGFKGSSPVAQRAWNISRQHLQAVPVDHHRLIALGLQRCIACGHSECRPVPDRVLLTAW